MKKRNKKQVGIPKMLILLLFFTCSHMLAQRCNKC